MTLPLFTLFFLLPLIISGQQRCYDTNNFNYPIGSSFPNGTFQQACALINGKATWAVIGCVDKFNKKVRKLNEEWCEPMEGSCKRCIQYGDAWGITPTGCSDIFGKKRGNNEEWSEPPRIVRCIVIDGIAYKKTVACVSKNGQRKENNEQWTEINGDVSVCRFTRFIYDINAPEANPHANPVLPLEPGPLGRKVLVIPKVIGVQ